jgi:hypothetical protein
MGITLKTQLLTAAALAAILAMPALAHAQTGYVDASYRNVDAGGGASLDGFMVGGAAVTELDGFKLQFNANHARVGTGGANIAASDFTAHVYKQNDSYAVGLYASATDDVGAGAYGIGAEGSKYWGNLTVGASVSYNSIDGGGDLADYGVNARYFVLPDLSVGANYDRFEVTGGGGGLNGYGIDAEWKTKSPVSLFASWSQLSANGGGDINKYSVGARWYFGGGSLKDQERSGAKAQRALSSVARLIF